MSDGRGRPWYREGLRFACIPGCGRCCVNHGEFTYLYLEPADADRLAEHFGLPLAEYLARDTGLDDGLVVVPSRDGACPYLDGTRCTVHDARPVQCRTFPFWRDLVRDRAAWRATAAWCPGIGEGEVHDRERIEALLSARRLG